MTPPTHTLEKPTMSDTTARKSKIEDCIYMILCCLVFALWGVLLALGV